MPRKKAKRSSKKAKKVAGKRKVVKKKEAPAPEPTLTEGSGTQP